MNDNHFIRGSIPMTKSEVRAVSLSKLELKRDSILYDVGAGTGSVAIEAALYAEKGHVYAVEQKEEGCRLARQNQEKFGVENLTVLEGVAPQALEEGKPVWQNGWQVTLYRGPAPAGEQGQLFRFERLTPPVILRPRQPGDRVFQGGQNKSVKKWMIDQKIPAAQRDGLPLVCDGQGVALICGGIARDGQREGIPGWTLAVRRI